MKKLQKIIGNPNQTKKTKVPLLIIAVLMIAGLILTGCPEPEPSVPSGVKGEKFSISQDVYEAVYAENNKIPAFIKFDGNLTISSGIGGTGKIEAGKLTFEIETPTSLIDFSNLKSSLEDDYTNVSLSVTDGKFSTLGGFIVTTSGSNYDSLSKWEDKGTYKADVANNNATSESVSYTYVNKDVTITGTGGTTNNYTFANLNITLKKGWNALYSKTTITGTYAAPIYNITTSVSDPVLKWVLK